MTNEMAQRYAILEREFPWLDRVEIDALLVVAAAIRDGMTPVEAYRRGNDYLISFGRDPVDLPE